MADVHKPVILPPPHASDDEIIARHPPIPRVATDEDSPLVIMELLQRIKVRDVMRTEIVVLSRRDTMRRAQDLMRRNRISGIPIAESGRLYGIVSVEDIIQALTGGWIDDLIFKHMSNHLIVLEADMPLAFALKYFENYNYGRFPVLNKEHRLVGIISQRDVTRTLLYELTLEINKLEKKAMQNASEPEGGEHQSYLLREWSVVHNDLENAGKAANDIKAILREHNVDRRLTRRIAVAAYELEINICIHSHGGTWRRTPAPASPTWCGPARTAHPRPTTGSARSASALAWAWPTRSASRTASTSRAPWARAPPSPVRSISVLEGENPGGEVCYFYGKVQRSNVMKTARISAMLTVATMGASRSSCGKCVLLLADRGIMIYLPHGRKAYRP